MEAGKANDEAPQVLIPVLPSVLPSSPDPSTQNNGSCSSHVLPLKSNGDVWTPCRQHANKKKRSHKDSSIPVGMQEMFHHSSYINNGEITHVISEPSFLQIHQSKKCRLEINGEEAKKHRSIDRETDCSPEGWGETEYECNVLQKQEMEKQHCMNANGKISSKNKQIEVSNGAKVTSPSTQAIHGDLSNETLCQYFPDHFSQTSYQNTSQENAAAIHSPPLASGWPSMPQYGASGQPDNNTTPALDSPLHGKPTLIRDQCMEGTHRVHDGLFPGMDMVFSQEQKKTDQLSPITELTSGISQHESCQTGNIQKFSPLITNTGVEGKELEGSAYSETLNPDLLVEKNNEQDQLWNQLQKNNQRLSESSTLTGLVESSMSDREISHEQLECVQESSYQDHQSNLKDYEPQGGALLKEISCIPEAEDSLTSSSNFTEINHKSVEGIGSTQHSQNSFKQAKCLVSHKEKQLNNLDKRILPQVLSNQTMLDSSPFRLPEPQENHLIHDQIKFEHLFKSTQNISEHVQATSFLHPQLEACGHKERQLTSTPQTQDQQGFGGRSINGVFKDEYSRKELSESSYHMFQRQHFADSPLSDQFNTLMQKQSVPVAHSNGHISSVHKEYRRDQILDLQEQVSCENRFARQPPAQLLSPHIGLPPAQQESPSPHSRINQQPVMQMNPETWQRPQFHDSQQRALKTNAVLQMHLLQKQEQQRKQESCSDIQHVLPVMKTEVELNHFQQNREEPTQKNHVKQEQHQLDCDHLQKNSILATMEHKLNQYPLPQSFYEEKLLSIKSPSKVKVESSGDVTIVSMNAELGAGEMEFSGHTPGKGDPNLSSFLESPIKHLNTPIKNLLDTPVKTQYEIPSCHCAEQHSERDEAPYYTHLGAGPNIGAIREMMEKRFGETGKAIRIEKVVYTGKEGKSTLGCPIAKWVIRRSSVKEKLLVLVRERAGHTCETATLIVVILIWEGIPTSLADRLYTELSDTLTKHGALTNRRCAYNEERTCACQGLDNNRCGASFSFGCSWSMYYNGCKFARSKNPRKFKLLGDDPREEEKVEDRLQNLATLVGPIYKQMAPDAYANQVEHENRALDCRLGLKEGRPFSGVTACLDFCAHAHRDMQNMQGGSTVVCTLTSEDNRKIGKIPEDEQLHVLPLYKISQTDEFGSEEAQQMKMKCGDIQVLSNFRRQVRMLSEPAKSCRQRKLEGKRGNANKLSSLESVNSKAEKTPIKLKEENPVQRSPVESLPRGYGQVNGAELGHLPQSPSLHLPQPYPSSPHPTQLGYSRFPQQMDPFRSTSQFPLAPAMAARYSSPLHVANPYMNGSHHASAYPGTPNSNALYSRYHCNGSIPTLECHSSYHSPETKPFNSPRPPMYPQQGLYAVSCPPSYHNPNMPADHSSPCQIRPTANPLGSYPFGPSQRYDPQGLEAISRASSAQLGLDYAALSKAAPYCPTPNSYLPQVSRMMPPGTPDLTPIKDLQEMSYYAMNGMSRTLLPMQAGFNVQNGNTPVTPEADISNPGRKEELWSDNEHNFLDPEIGGVAVAPSHGSILIECAKRELHATTPLKNPDRQHPTRISLVFYQHKNLNEAKHGMALWEAKMAEKAREKEEEAEKHGGDTTPTKSKKSKREPSETSHGSELPCKHFIKSLGQRSMSCTTNTFVSTAPYAFTRVTGPYSKFL